MRPKVINPGTRGFYGWIALSGVMLTTLINVGAFIMSFGVFMPVICAELGWSRGIVSTGLLVGLLCNGLPSPLWGYLVSRFGPRAMIVLGNTLIALALSGMSQIQEVWHVYVLYSLAGLGVGMGGMIPGSTVANNWFVRKRSLVLGILTAAGGLGGFIFPPIVTILISSTSWRLAWLVLGGIFFIGGSLIGGLILVRNRPEDMGQMPDGLLTDPLEEAGIIGHPPATGEEPGAWQIKQVLRVPTTWLIGAFTLAFAFGLGTMTAHQVAYLQDSGLSPMTAATTVSVVAGTGILGSLGFGTLALRFNLRYLASGCFGILLMAFIILLTTKNIALIYVYSMLFGIGTGTLLTAMPTFVGAYYGRACYPRVLGIITPFQVIAQATSATIAGVIYDATGTYTPAFLLITAVSLVGLICAFLARKPELPQANGEQ